MVKNEKTDKDLEKVEEIQARTGLKVEHGSKRGRRYHGAEIKRELLSGSKLRVKVV